ncbi:MAG: FAD-dependent oxidoreductase [Spirochaetota bacterium]
MPQWRRVAQATDIKEDEPLVIELDEDESVLLTRVEGRVVACGNTCPHYGGPLGDGVLRGGRVVCPYHNTTFHVASGELDRTPAIDDLPTYEVKEEDGGVFLGERTDPQIAMPTGSDDREVLIVGAGAAGAICAETLRKEGFAGRITIVTSDSEGPYDRPMLSKGLLSGDAPAKYLPLRPNSFYESLGITVVTNTEITSVDTAAKEVETSGGERLRGDFIVLATGGVPRTLDIPGAELEGVFTLRSHTDAEAIANACHDRGRAAVIGASFIGMEVAAQLRQRGLEISVIEPEPQPMHAALGSDIGAWLRSVHEAEGVKFHLGHKPGSITGETRVEGVLLDDGSTIDADLVVMGVGVEPRVDYLAQSDLIDGDTTKGVRVNERLATSVDGIYAAGDIAVYPGWEGEYRVEHWVHAQEQGRYVARAILGDTAPYRRVPFFWSRQYETGIKYVGFPEKYDHIQYDGVAGSGEFIAGFFVAERLIGAAAMGKAYKFAKVAELLEQGERLDRQGFLGIRDAPKNDHL